MAFDTSNDFSEFDGIGSGESGTVEGLLPIEGSASAFRYKKVIQIVVLGALADDLSFDIKGNWKIRVRENASRNPDGSYAGAILFEQEIFWTAIVTVVQLAPGLNLITWQPQGPAGSGEQRTSIANGEACAIIENVYAPKAGEMEAYGQTGAWRFLDKNVNPESLPGQKYDAERGFSDWEDEGVASSDGYTFFAEYQSADFLCDLPEGAILDTVFEHWAFGTIDTEALYTFSYKAGEELFDAVSDSWSGQRFWFHKVPGGMSCARTRIGNGSYAVAPENPLVVSGAFGSFRAFGHGHNLFVLHQKGDGVGLRYSLDDGNQWDGVETMIENVKQIDAIMDAGGGEILVLGTAKTAIGAIPSGALVRVALTRTDEKTSDGKPRLWKVKSINQIASKGGTALPSKPKGRLTRAATTLEWTLQSGDAIQVWLSTDEGFTFELASTSE